MKPWSSEYNPVLFVFFNSQLFISKGPFSMRSTNTVTGNSNLDMVPHLGRHHLDELIEKAKLSHFAVETLPTVLHARLKYLGII